MAKTLGFAALLSCALSIPAAGQPELVRNINEQLGTATDSRATFFGAWNGEALFAAASPVGTEPWVSDGTLAGTRVLKDVQPGGAGSFPLWRGAHAGLVFFTASALDPVSGRSGFNVWRTDGTPGGTVQLTTANHLRDWEAFVVGEVPGTGLVVLAAPDQANGYRPWVSDGTPAGTRPLTDPSAGQIFADAGGVGWLGDLYFAGYQSTSGASLWRTDGTAAGTVRLASFASSPLGLQVGNLAATPSGVVFHAYDEAHGHELWVTDGTPGATRLLADLTPGPTDSAFRLRFLAGDGVVFFLLDGADGQRRLWRTDGTAAGTFALVGLGSTDPNPGFLGLTVLGGRAYFFLGSPSFGVEPWVSDGSVAGTRRLADVCPGPCDSGATQFFSTPLGVLFPGRDPDHGFEPWLTDGTPAGTRRWADVCPGSCSGGGTPLGRIGDLMIFQAQGGLWASDGGPGGGVRLVQFSLPNAFKAGSAALPGAVLFHADDGLHGAEPWVTDGTPAGTHILKDITATPEGGSDPHFFFRHGDLAAFFARDGIHRESLWMSDGTAPGTRLVYEPDEGRELSSIRVDQLASLGGRLYFANFEVGATVLRRTDGTPGSTVELRRFVDADAWLTAGDDEVFVSTGEAGLWRTDGTPAGTRRLGAVETTGAGVWFQGRLVFGGLTGSNDAELWASDGTTSGTVVVFEHGGFGSLRPEDLRIAGNRLFFRGQDENNRRGLWTSDGTASGTRQVPGLPEDPDPEFLGAAGGRIVFTRGLELWAADGTPQGTVRLAPQFSLGERPHRIAELPGRLAALGREPGGSQALWITDGTPAGTLHEPHPVPGDRFLSGLWAAGDDLLLLTRDAEGGADFWIVPPGLSGLRRIADFPPGEGPQTFGSDPFAVVLDDEVLFSAEARGLGKELWKASLDADLPDASPAAPRGLHAEGIAGGGIRVTWIDVATQESGYRVEITPEGGAAVAIEAPANAQEAVADGFAEGVVHSVRVRAESPDGVSAWAGPDLAVPLPAVVPPCAPSDTALCLLGGRFAVTVRWRDQHNGGSGEGHAVPFPGSDRTGTFWFFNDANVELIVKALDGRPVNGAFWAFYGALSDVEYWVTVVDTQGRRSRTYHNPPGEICGRGDTSAFPDPIPAGSSDTAPVAPRLAPPSIVSPTPLPRGTCVPGPQALCLLGGRYQVEVAWADQHNGGTGVGQAVPGTDKTGYFWFFNAANVELVVKMLDGTTVNGHRWVFYGALSDVEYTITVTDTETGETAEYHNPPGEICGRADTAAF